MAGWDQRNAVGTMARSAGGPDARGSPNRTLWRAPFRPTIRSRFGHDPFSLPRRRRQPIDGIYAEAIVLCMNEGRRPAGHEVHVVAARVWSDIQVGSPKIPWDDIAPGCGRHRRIVAAALAALGDARGDGKPP